MPRAEYANIPFLLLRLVPAIALGAWIATIATPLDAETTGQLVGSASLETMTSTLASDRDEGYPPGTLVPEVDLDLQAVRVKVPEPFRGAVSENLTLNLPPGFTASVFAYDRLRKPRLMAFDDNGVLHVANMGTGEIVAFPDRDRDGVADERIVALRGLEENHSLAFYKGDLYVAEEHQVIRARDADGDLVYEEEEVFIADIPWEGWHDTRTLVVDELNEKMYLSVGSPCDLCRMEQGFQVVGHSGELVPQDSTRGTILQFNADGSGRKIFATGVRNVIGMDFHPVTNELWGNNNGHDLEGRTRPPEWIDIIRDGDFMGYPFVHSHQAWNDFGIDEYQLVLPITRTDSALVATQKRPVALVPAHYAPMGIHFYTGDQFPARYKDAAFVAFRAGKAKLSSHPGYMVSAIFSDPDGSNARMGSFITGFQAGQTQDDVWGFPVGLASDRDGNLYVTSDNRNHLIFKISHSPISGSWEHNLPDDLPLGAALDVRVMVRLERLDPDGGTPQLRADLSALGGPADLPLEAMDDRTYRLDTRLETEGLPIGTYPIAVRIEQEVRGVVRGFDFRKNITILPQDLTVFDERLAARWQMRGDGGAQIRDAVDEPILYGERATAVDAEPVNFFTHWAIELRPEAPIGRLGFAGVRFAFHPGDVAAPTIPFLNLYVDALSIDLVRDPKKFHIDLEHREWQIIEVPFEAFDQINDYGPGLRDQVDFIDSIRIEGNLTGTFYLDDVRLVTRIPAGPPAPTAVLEERGAGEPEIFSLAQNFPNPFNSTTAILFSLPQAAEVELAIYNLTGQRVVKLLRGRREAGHYTAHWDGRTDAVDGLATGVYIYRLRSGDRVQSRKLLLLR